MNIVCAEGLTVKHSPIDGRGCFATRHFPRGRKIAEYAGERISRREIARRLRGKRRIHICAVDSYWAIDGSKGGNGTQFINHSCQPNCSIRIVSGHILFFALYDISPGEELVVDYEVSYHSDRKSCHCGAADCRGRINLVK
ncbi:MAG: SET domain-containing protein [Blastocatellia bacterium]|jgi:SET domain-containing protein